MHRCDRLIEVRAAFLACGSLAAGARGYHLEFVARRDEIAERLRWMLRSAGAAPKSTRRKGRAVLYFKDFDAIVELLTRIGAFGAVLALEDVRALRETKNRIHRLVNTEAANLQRSAEAAAAQRRVIEYLTERIRACAPDARVAGSRGASPLVSRRVARGAGAALQSADRKADRERTARGAQPAGRPAPRRAGERETGQVNALMRIGINGFGRIGRNFTKAVVERHPDIEIVAINDLIDAQQCAHLFKYDSNYGAYEGSVGARDGTLAIDRQQVKVFAERDPARLPWRDLGVDVVIESTGLFTERREGARPHRQRRREEGHHLGARER